MSPLATGLLTIFGVISAIILISAYFSKIPRKIGFRNVRRRLGNTLLVVIGSMVGTALISGSLVLSDSLDKTFQNLVEERYGELDLIISLNQKEFNPLEIASLSKDETETLTQNLVNDAAIDGAIGVSTFTIAPQKIDENGKTVINAYQVTLGGVDINEFNNFGQKLEELPNLSGNKAIVSETMASVLELNVGDKIRFRITQSPIELVVQDIVPDQGMVGGKTILVDRAFINEELGLEKGASNSIVVSANGGVEPDDYKGEEFSEDVESVLSNFESESVTLVAVEQKQQALDGFGLKFFVDVFLVLSLFGVFSGILLIVNLYSMLASERKSEMGILRAIALTRFKLTRTFVYEGYVYSVLAGLLGSFAGVAIGFALVYALSNMFESLFALDGSGSGFDILFGFEVSSLITSFAAGSLITILTTIFTSVRISRLNIVSAIRETEEIKESRITFGWVIKTILIFLVFCNSISAFAFSFLIKTSFEDMREQGGSNNYFAEMTQEQFDSTVATTQAYLLYLGVVASAFFAVMLVNRIVTLAFKKDISKFTYSIASLGLVIFTSLMTKIDFIAKSFEEDSGVILLFISGATLVISFSLLVTFNLNIIIYFINLLLFPLKGLKPVFLIALRYPSENKSRTGLTLVMFALIIFLISYVSINKAMATDQNKDLYNKLLGGYDVIIMPDNSFADPKANEILEEVDKVENVEKVEKLLNTRVIMPEYKYKDLEEIQTFGPPITVGHTDEDYFETTLDGIPEEFIENNPAKLAEYSGNYSSEEEVWQAVMDDENKVILGINFAAQGFIQKPDLKLGDKVQIADIFNNTVSEKEIIGVVTQDAGFGFSFYSNVITTTNHLEDQFASDYLSRYSTINVLAQLDENADQTETVNEIKKSIVDYNILFVLQVSEIAGATQAFINSIMAMLQGFLAFSLVVGTSGLAIILVRSVNERKQQIGMLRSLGFQRKMVLTSFFIEATFITFLGIIVGISMGLISASSIIEVAQKESPDLRLIIPWGEIVIISVLVYIASIIFSLLPSIKAARLSPVEATNYPE